MIKVVIADNETILRESVQYRIDADNDIEVVGCARDGIEAIALCGRFLPDIVLMDIGMPICDGIQATSLIKSKYNSIKIIMLAGNFNTENIEGAVRSGADGYVSKDINTDDLITVVKKTVKGLHVMNEYVYNFLVGQFKVKNEVPLNIELTKKEAKLNFNLTERELDIIRLIVQGKSNKEMAAGLYVTVGTVKNFVTKIFTKLGVRNRVQLVAFALENEII